MLVTLQQKNNSPSASGHKRGPETLYFNIFQQSLLIHKWRRTIIIIKRSPSLLTLVRSLETPLRCEHCIYFLTASMGKSIIHVLKIGECAAMNRETRRPHPHSCTIFCHKSALSLCLPLLIKPKTGDGLAFLSMLNNLSCSQSSFIWGKLKWMFVHQKSMYKNICTHLYSFSPLYQLCSEILTVFTWCTECTSCKCGSQWQSYYSWYRDRGNQLVILEWLP